LERALLHFSSRDALDIEGMGEAVINQMVSLKLLKSLADIYKLKLDDLLKLELFKEKKANNLLSSIEKSKGQSLERLIFALGIRHVGQKAAYTLAQEFGDMDKLMQAKLEDLDSIPEIGEVMAGAILNYFNLSQTRKLIRDLKEAGVNMRKQSGSFKINKLTGKAVVFTGQMAEFSRTEAEELVRQSKGKVSSSVSSKTDILVAGENMGTKFSKARQLGVKIISEEEFKEMLK
jgi:DNA ligase (NAD+)